MAEIEIDGVRYRVRVDHDQCMGNRVCEAHLAEVFTVDDDTNLSTAVGGELQPRARRRGARGRRRLPAGRDHPRTA